MKSIKLTFLLALSFLTLNSFDSSNVASTASEDLAWFTSVDKAIEESNKTGKPIFGFFTGSDWCGWCIKLQRDVFVKQKFVDWAKDNVILLELDFPRRKQLPAELAAQNQELQQVFRVSGFPTIWLFEVKMEEDSKRTINAFGSLGYPSGAVKGQEEVKFLNTANSILSSAKKH